MLLSLDDADLYPEDLDLYNSNQWLNSNCMNFSLRALEDEDWGVTVGSKADVYLMDPCVLSYLRFQVESDEERKDYCDGNAIFSKTWILAPVSNAPNLFESGSHWSLLVYHVPSNKAVHFDSMNDSNKGTADSVLNVICQTLGRSVGFTLFSPRHGIRQSDGFSCGIFTILFAQFVSHSIAQDAAFFESEFLALSDDKCYLRDMKVQISDEDVVKYLEKIKSFIKMKMK